MSAHAELGPSSAKRWMVCTVSPEAVRAAVEEFGARPSGPAAEYGTALHEAAEWCIKTGANVAQAAGKIFNKHQILFDDLDNFEQYVDIARDLIRHADEYAVEMKVIMIPGLVWGTADFVAIVDGVLYVIDLKTGYVRVDAVDNPQLMLYALGALKAFDLLYDIKHVEMVIAQERIDNESRWRVDVDQIWAFESRLKKVVEEIQTDPQYRPTAEACQYCEASAVCPALAEVVRKEAQQDFEQMSVNQLAMAWERLPLLKHYISGVEAATMHRLETGHKVPGLKLVEGVRRRAWADEAHAEQYLSRRIPKFKENAYTHKLKSPAQIEKLVKQFKDDLHRPVTDKMLGKLIEKAPGKPTIAPEDDKRPPLEYGDRAAADFAAVGESETVKS